MKRILQCSDISPDHSRRRFVQGLATSGAMLGLSSLLTPAWAQQAAETKTGMAPVLSGCRGLRLRYEIRREIAPYMGVEWSRKYGDTKDFARAAGQESSEARLVAG
ncbi:Copper resistance protein B, partial [hydrothermal vent metagenome]